MIDSGISEWPNELVCWLVQLSSLIHCWGKVTCLFFFLCIEELCFHHILCSCLLIAKKKKKDVNWAHTFLSVFRIYVYPGISIHLFLCNICVVYSLVVLDLYQQLFDWKLSSTFTTVISHISVFMQTHACSYKQRDPGYFQQSHYLWPSQHLWNYQSEF